MRAFFHRLWQLSRGLTQRYFAHGVGRDAAAMAYYMLFSLFPSLIILSKLLAQAQVQLHELLLSLQSVLPPGVTELVEEYLHYAGEGGSQGILSVSLLFTIYFPLRTAHALVHSVRKAMGCSRDTGLLRYVGQLLFYTVLLALAMVFTGFVLLSGQEILQHILPDLFFSVAGIWLWDRLRFFFLGLFMLGALLGLYCLALPGRGGVWKALPGALGALVAWLLSSGIFAFYLSHWGNYTKLYGSIATVMVTLFWLWLSSVTVIMGAELNGLCMEKKEGQST